MKNTLQQLILTAITLLKSQQTLPADLNDVAIKIEHSKDPKNGDFACSIALLLAKPAKMAPRDLAQLIVAALPASEYIAKIEIAGPGFINFFLTQQAASHVVNEILAARSSYGQNKMHAGTRIHIEYVSSNPTGPLHVGHGRSAAFGASLANLLEAVGYTLHREYYVNDAGRQMDILTTSIWLRYLELCGEPIVFPENGYKGEYVKNIAEKLRELGQPNLQQSWAEMCRNVPADEPAGGDKEKHIDALIDNAKCLLGENYQIIFDLGLSITLADMQADLTEFRVTYDQWFSERELVKNGAIDHALQVLHDRGYTYQQEGALWFKSTAFGDEKDRVLERSNGQRTYFANDIAYHLTKLERGNNIIIDVLGADHHGYVPRIKAAMQALASRGDALTVPLLQFVSLYRGKEKVAMSTRAGEFITLRQLRAEVGNDAARFFYVSRRADQPIDFDLELAKSQSNENPVYYIQYAHARICSVLRQLGEKSLPWELGQGMEHIGLLTDSFEHALFKILARYPEIIELAATAYEPNQLANYLRELATEFHAYYNKHQFIVDDVDLRAARLNLICAVKQVIANGLALLGISAPEEM